MRGWFKRMIKRNLAKRFAVLMNLRQISVLERFKGLV